MTAATVVAFGNGVFKLTAFKLMIARAARTDMVDIFASIVTVIELLAF